VVFDWKGVESLRTSICASDGDDLALKLHRLDGRGFQFRGHDLYVVC
jgi:hypothetical protein